MKGGLGLKLHHERCFVVAGNRQASLVACLGQLLHSAMRIPTRRSFWTILGGISHIQRQGKRGRRCKLREGRRVWPCVRHL